jgi:hypothetical protein
MGGMSNIRFFGRQKLASSKLGTKVLVFFNNSDEKYKRLLADKYTDVCIEGYPRCANSFAFNKFDSWNPGLKFARHLHIPHNVKQSVALGVPVSLLIRFPWIQYLPLVFGCQT